MNTDYMNGFALWRRTLAAVDDDYESSRQLLRVAFLGFRERVAQLVQAVNTIAPDLTVHDISHIDALWRVADEIAGENYPINPAEAFVLGGSFLIHDAAHVFAAYEDGLKGIEATSEFRDIVAQQFRGIPPASGTLEERSVLLQVLRELHAKRARELPFVTWKHPTKGPPLHLLEHLEVREYYGELIGEIAESHHWPSHLVAERFEGRSLNSPPFLAPARWPIDPLKLALLLRTADAAHVDSERAPWFLFALQQPSALSQPHWNFQAKLGQATRTDNGELRLSSGSAFNIEERASWWLAYDVAQMIDKELRDASIHLRDAGKPAFAASSVEHVLTPEAFATNVRAQGWEPVDVKAKIGDVERVIVTLGGAQLYGDRPEVALRELVQNAIDAVHARRHVGLEGNEGSVAIALEEVQGRTWLHIRDNGIGMSRYVLTEVLLDFGRSLWSSPALRAEIPGLASSEFKPIGKFGIGFFSIFMLGKKVVVRTRRYLRTSNDSSDQWVLEFNDGLSHRPTLRRPTPAEVLTRTGTVVSVGLAPSVLSALKHARWHPHWEDSFFGLRPSSYRARNKKELEDHLTVEDLGGVVGSLCPTSDVNLTVNVDGNDHLVATAGDWRSIESSALISRIYSSAALVSKQGPLIDLFDAEGTVVGRMTHGGITQHAAVTYGGIRNGSIPKLIGVALGDNNTELVRKDSKAIVPIVRWQQWAEEWLAAHKTPGLNALIDLHPLVPKRDLPVWVVNKKQLNEAQLGEWLKHRAELRVLVEEMRYEDHDYVSQYEFDRSLEIAKDILVSPDSDEKLEKAIGVQPIKYFKRLRSILQAVWTEYEEFDEDDVEVATVNGAEIVRPVLLFERRTSPSQT